MLIYKGQVYHNFNVHLMTNKSKKSINLLIKLCFSHVTARKHPHKQICSVAVGGLLKRTKYPFRQY